MATIHLLRFFGLCILGLTVFTSSSSRAEITMNVNFRSGMTIASGNTFRVSGTAQSTTAPITNISVMLGDAKIAEQAFNEQALSFDFPWLRNNAPGQFDLIVTARDASGATFSSDHFTTYFPTNIAARIVIPEAENVTVTLGQSLLVRGEPIVDIGHASGLEFSFQEAGYFRTDYNPPSPSELTWYPHAPGNYRVVVSPILDVVGPVQGDYFMATVVPWKLPLITQESFYLGDQQGGRLMYINSSSETPQAIQWLHNGQPIPGATNSTLTIQSPQAADDGYYVAQVDNFAGRVVSGMANQFFDGNGGGRVLFSNHTEGIDAPIYSPGQEPPQPPYIRVVLLAGATINRMRVVTPEIVVTNGYFDAGVITLPQIAPGQKAYVQLAARDEIPMLLESALYGSSPIMEITAGGDEPTRLTGLKPLTLKKYAPGLTARFTADTPPSARQGGSVELKPIIYTANTETNFTYSWSKNGTPIPGATNLNLSIQNAQRTDAAYYSIFISNGTIWREIGTSLAVEDSVALRLTTDGHLQLNGNIGSHYTIQTSTDLRVWSPLRTITAESSVTSIPVTPPATVNAFYRVKLEPN